MSATCRIVGQLASSSMEGGRGGELHIYGSDIQGASWRAGCIWVRFSWGTIEMGGALYGLGPLGGVIVVNAGRV